MRKNLQELRWHLPRAGNKRDALISHFETYIPYLLLYCFVLVTLRPPHTLQFRVLPTCKPVPLFLCSDAFIA